MKSTHSSTSIEIFVYTCDHFYGESHDTAINTQFFTSDDNCSLWFLFTNKQKNNFIGLVTMLVVKTRDISSYGQKAKQWRAIMMAIGGGLYIVWIIYEKEEVIKE